MVRDAAMRLLTMRVRDRAATTDLIPRRREHPSAVSRDG
jgi:hypothetical protein